jgi:hypothetical protein
MFKPDNTECGLLGRNPYFPGNQQVFCHAGGENAQ